MENAEKTSINEALGIHQDWKVLTDARISDLIEDKDTISEVIETEAMTIKVQEFGEGNYELTSYEKKLVFAGFMIAQEIHYRKMRAAAVDAMAKLLAGRLGIDPENPE